MSKLEYKPGDKVVYPAHGVGVIESIQLRKVSGAEQYFYMVTIIDTGAKVMVPVGKASDVGLRKVVDKDAVGDVFKILKDRDVKVDMQTWNRRHREYTQRIKTGSVIEIAKVIRDLIILKGDKELSFGEKRMLDTAQSLLVKEISIAKQTDEDKIRLEIEKITKYSFSSLAAA